MPKHPEQTEQPEVPLSQQPKKPLIDETAIATQTKRDKGAEATKRAEENTKIAAIREKLGLPPTFTDSLQPTNFDARNINLWKLKDDPTKLVRESRIKEGQTLDELEKSIREGESLFAEMHDKYGIRVVSMKSTREKNKEGNEAIFTLVDKIEGQNLSEIKELPEEAKDELESLYLSLGQHYYDSWKQKLQYWGDGRSDQFVYGAKHGEEIKHFYLTDVDPEFYREGDDKWRTIEAALGSVCHDLVENENKFKPKVRFQKARDGLLKIINEMLKKNPDWNMLAEAKDWLES